MSFDSGMFTGSLGGILGGLFGHSNRPYDAAMNQYNNWNNQATATQQPFVNAGHEGMQNYQNWLNSQQNPSGFINEQMNNYQESPYAHNLQQQAMRAGQNAASANGTLGSSPMMQQLQQNAGNISSQDQKNWLHNVLGINTQYGEGEHSLMNAGQNAANQLNTNYNNMGGRMGEAAYGINSGHNQDFWGGINGGLGLIGSFL